MGTPATLVWLALMLITCATTWWLSKDAVSAVTGTVLIILLAAFKTRLVLIHFMELGHAPRRWRLLFEIWPIACAAIILGVYLQSRGLV